MFIVSKPVTSFGACGGFSAASSSCQSEYNGSLESAAIGEKSIVGLRGKLRRNSSNLSQDLNAYEICIIDATQIVVEFNSMSTVAHVVRVTVPTGETHDIYFDGSMTHTTYTPMQQGCGHGVWSFVVLTKEIDGSEIVHTERQMKLSGVGTLFFNIFEDLDLRLERKEFLQMSQCHHHRH